MVVVVIEVGVVVVVVVVDGVVCAIFVRVLLPAVVNFLTRAAPRLDRAPHPLDYRRWCSGSYFCFC